MLLAQRAGHKNKYLEPREMSYGDQQGDGRHGSTTQTSPDSWDESASIVVSDTIRGRYLMRYKPSSQRGPASLWLAIVNAAEPVRRQCLARTPMADFSTLPLGLPAH
jgi:hypothetical protein